MSYRLAVIAPNTQAFIRDVSEHCPHPLTVVSPLTLGELDTFDGVVIAAHFPFDQSGNASGLAIAETLHNNRLADLFYNGPKAILVVDTSDTVARRALFHKYWRQYENGCSPIVSPGQLTPIPLRGAVTTVVQRITLLDNPA